MASAVAIVLAGGGGSRLWPASTRARPKQFLDVLGEGRSLLRATVDRLEGVVAPQDVWVVTTRALADECADTLPEVARARILVEPAGRNTAAAIALALLHVRARAPTRESTVVALPADHHFGDPQAFRRDLAAAIAHARTGCIVALGVTPTYAATGFGWIERGHEPLAPAPGDGGRDVYAALSFVEKPDPTRAQALLDAGRHAWNAGIFVMDAVHGLARLERCLPATMRELAGVGAALHAGAGVAAATAHAYERIESISFDVGVMEKQDDLRVVPMDAGWTDVGSWRAVHELRRGDGDGNVVDGAAVALVDTSGSLVVSDGPTVGVVGMRDVAVIAVGGRILVCPLARAEAVRAITDATDPEPP
jgi:mannose-1-phosphate guanylyltransferase